MKQLTIEHNHGVLVLADVELMPYEYNGRSNNVAKGTVVRGSTTNRLFHATSTTHEKAGVEKEYDIYGRKPYLQDAENDHWYVSVVTCG